MWFIYLPGYLCWRKHTYLSRTVSPLPHVEASIIELQTSRFPFSLGSIYVHPSFLVSVIRQLVALAETHEIIIAGGFKSKEFFSFQYDCLSATESEAEAFLSSSDSTSSFFPSTLSFIRMHDDGTVNSFILHDFVYPSDSWCISLSNPVFSPEGDHDPVVFSLCIHAQFKEEIPPTKLPPEFRPIICPSLHFSLVSRPLRHTPVST